MACTLAELGVPTWLGGGGGTLSFEGRSRLGCLLARGLRVCLLLGALVAAVVGTSSHVWGHEPAAELQAVDEDAIEEVLERLTSGSIALIDGTGRVLAQRSRGDEAPQPLEERAVVQAIKGYRLTGDAASTLWSFFAGEENASFRTLPIIEALVRATSTTQSREAMWSALGEPLRLHLSGPERPGVRERSLYAFFERHRDALRPAITEVRETELSTDYITELMLDTRVFGRNLEDSVAWVSDNIPAATIRHMEYERGIGRPVRWEYAAFERMVKWKDARLVPGAAKFPRTLEQMDTYGESFVIIFNNLHGFDEWYRTTMLKGLGPVEVFNIVVSGEKELYRLGTSGYRDHLHPLILRGIKQRGSFEAFLQHATARLPTSGTDVAGRRASVFLRVATSFGLLEQVLETIRDHERFIADVIASAGDPRSFEGNGAVIMDILTAETGSATARSFTRSLLEQLYARHGAESDLTRKIVYGGLLSVYQTLTGNRREPAIDLAYPLDDAMFRIPFERLFSRDGDGMHTHRMFMRMDRDVDAQVTFSSFRSLMEARGAKVRQEKHYEVYRLTGQGRAIEIYANKPSAAGTAQGIAEIEALVRGERIETVIGRGHTSIVRPLRTSSELVLGDRLKDVALVFVGTCGGDASVHDLMSTFGFKPYLTTRATGRMVINNAIIDSYITRLMALHEGDRLSVQDVLANGTARFRRRGVGDEMQADAGFYRVSLATVLAAQLFEFHLRKADGPMRVAAPPAGEQISTPPARPAVQQPEAAVEVKLTPMPVPSAAAQPPQEPPPPTEAFVRAAKTDTPRSEADASSPELAPKSAPIEENAPPHWP
jgi:hypothetical protein